MEITFKIENKSEWYAAKEMLRAYVNQIMPTWREIKDAEGVNKESSSYKKLEAGVRMCKKLHEELDKWQQQ